MNDLAFACEILFWSCLLLLLYSYVVYPLLLLCFVRLFGATRTPAPVPDSMLPSVSLLIAAHNEESVIEERLRNAVALDYPDDKLEILVASDGSRDLTADIVRRFGSPKVRLLDYPQNRGKAAVLNTSITECRGEIVVLSDANTQTDADAIRQLVRWFADPKVGVVCGKLVLTDPRTGRNVDSLYWKYETVLKNCEGKLGGLLGANGAIYAIRRGLFPQLPTNTIVDDLVLPLLAKLQSGCRLVYDRDAVAREETAPNIGLEFRRRSRIGAGGFQSIGYLWRLLNPRCGWVCFTFASHKILRWLGPFFMIGMLISNVLLWQSPFYFDVLLAQVAFYGMAVVAAYLPARSKPLKLLRLTTMFTLMNLALFVGFWRWLRGRQKGTWERTTRASGAAAEASSAEAALPCPK